jgi:hypothetical protein
MRDARWLEIFDDMSWAVAHFSRALELHAAGGFEGDSLEAYKSKMALMQAMQAGHTSLESGLERILELFGEEKPTGSQYHADLVRRIARDRPGIRPSIIAGELAEAIDETRRFRHVVRKNYNNFRVAEATRALQAAALLRDRLVDTIQAFARAVDR